MFNHIKKTIYKLFSKYNIIDESNLTNDNIINIKDVKVTKDNSKDEDFRIYIPPTYLKKIFKINNQKIADIKHDFYCKNSTSNLQHIINNTTHFTTPARAAPQNFENDNYQDIIVYKDHNPPSFYGLKNCNRIIPSYYFSENNKTNGILDIDYLYIIIDDIRNQRKLNNYQIEYIYNLQEKYKDEIIGELIKQSETNINFIESMKSKSNSNVLISPANSSFISKNISNDNFQEHCIDTIMKELIK